MHTLLRVLVETFARAHGCCTRHCTRLPQGCSGFHGTALDLGGWHTAKGYLWGHSEEKTEVNMAMRSSFHCEVSMPQRRTPRVTEEK